MSIINDSIDAERGLHRGQLITVIDLEKFKDELLEGLAELLQSSSNKKWLKSSEVRKLLQI